MKREFPMRRGGSPICKSWAVRQSANPRVWRIGELDGRFLKWRELVADFIASEGVPRFCNLAMCRSVLYCISEAAMNMLNGFRLATVVLTALLLAPGLLQAQRQAPMTSVQPSGRTLGARPANTVRVRPAQAPRVAVVRTQIGRASCRERV